MNTLSTTEEILDFAIGQEQEAADFYEELARTVDRPVMKKVFTEFAGEERGHKAKLLAIRAGRRMTLSAKQIVDLKLADHLTAVQPSGKLDYQGALIVAMQREKEAFRLYSGLAEQTTGEIREVLLGLAMEEAKHKLRFETEYDERVLTEN